MGRSHLLSAAALIGTALSATAADAKPQVADQRSGGGVRALEQAGDAFGVRIGVEQIGLYSENQVRGLSLQDSGNYRVNGTYFVRAGGFADPVLAGVTTRVGFNALEADFPAPSGIIEYRLKSPFTAPRNSIEVALREYGTRFLDLSMARLTADGAAGLLLGAQSNLGRSSSDLKGHSHRFGAVGVWRPTDAVDLTAFASLNRFDFEGTYGVALKEEALPPPMPHPRRYVPSWGDHDGEDWNGGVIAAWRPSDTLTLNGSAIYSRLNLDQAEYVLMSLDRHGLGEASVISNRARNTDAWALEAGASWRHAPGRRLYAEVRARRSRNLTGPGVTQRVNGVDLMEGLMEPPEPILPDLPRTLDMAEQVTAGVGYEASWSGLRLKGGVQRSRHERTFTPPGLPSFTTTSSPWLYDISAVAALGKRWTMFATATRGLEDSGVAPANAANRNEALPPVVARQQELGLRLRATETLTLIASAYSIEKAAAGFDAAGVYGLVGDLRHRGLELSLAGRLREGLRIVAGAALLDAERAGPQIEAGILSAEPPGVARYQALGGVSWAVPGLDGLSLDAQVNHSGSRRVRSSSDLRTGPLTTVDVGGLYAFRVQDANVTLRLRVLNLLDEGKWVAMRSETLDRPNRRGVRLSLTTRY